MASPRPNWSPNSTPGGGGQQPPGSLGPMVPPGSTGVPSANPGQVAPRATNPAGHGTIGNLGAAGHGTVGNAGHGTIGHGGGAGAPGQQGVSKIQPFAQALGGGRHEDKWKRSPNVTGTGAVHIKSFHCRLTEDSLAVMDQQINEWLDAHPQYEVKFVTSVVGDWTGKLKEPALIVQVWV